MTKKIARVTIFTHSKARNGKNNLRKVTVFVSAQVQRGENELLEGLGTFGLRFLEGTDREHIQGACFSTIERGLVEGNGLGGRGLRTEKGRGSYPFLQPRIAE